jgi:hypothetical protein
MPVFEQWDLPVHSVDSSYIAQSSTTRRDLTNNKPATDTQLATVFLQLKSYLLVIAVISVFPTQKRFTHDTSGELQQQQKKELNTEVDSSPATPNQSFKKQWNL